MVKVITSLEEFEESQKKSDNSVFLLDFYADWCGPCRMLTPVLENLSEKFKDSVTVLKIDVDQVGTGYLSQIRDIEFVSSLLHRHTIPGGRAEFDMPK